eukprot:15474079-Alexandrium_andersonii.AAC.1
MLEATPAAETLALHIDSSSEAPYLELLQRLCRACVPACLHACVPVCLRACAPARLRACVPACLRACAPARL